MHRKGDSLYLLFKTFHWLLSYKDFILINKQKNRDTRFYQQADDMKLLFNQHMLQTQEMTPSSS